jgi:hypothetical protein
VLVLSAPEDLHELFQDCSLTAVASLRKASGIMVVAVNFVAMFVIAILCTKCCGADGTSEVVDMVFAIERSNV